MIVRTFLLSLSAVLLISLLPVIATAVDSMEAYEKRGYPPFIVGACTHFHQFKGYWPGNAQLLSAAGIASTRDECSWSASEAEKGQLVMQQRHIDGIRIARENGLIPLQILDYANKFYDSGNYPTSAEAVEGFARYAEWSVTTFGSDVNLYQVWNEWDGGCGMPTQFRRSASAEQYIHLLATVYPRIKRANPAAAVILNSVCTGDAYLEKLLQLGALNHIDIASLHTYTRGAPPKVWHERMLHVGEMLAKYNDGNPVPLYVTEMGYPNQLTDAGTAYDIAADYLAQIYLMARTLPYIKGLWWYDFQDDGLDPRESQHNYGIVRPDLTPKPAYFAMKSIAKLVGQAECLGRIDVNDPDTWVVSFKLEGKPVWAMWSTADDDERKITLERTSNKTDNLIVQIVGRESYSKAWGDRDWVGNRQQSQPRENEVSFSLRVTPILVSGDLTDVSVTGVKAISFPELQRPQRAFVQIPEGAAIVVASDKNSSPRPINFSKSANFRKIAASESWGGADNLGGSFTLSYDHDNLVLKVAITDDVFFQNQSDIDSVWMGDSLQFAFRTSTALSAADRYEIDLALTTEGAKALLRHAPDKGFIAHEVPELQPKITQNGQETTYTVTIPATFLQLKAYDSGLTLGFSLLVNDNDGKGRRGYLHWGEGIGHGKNPQRYYLIMFE